MAEQDGYQVRFDWGEAGVRATMPAIDVLVWADEIGPAGELPALDVPGAVVFADLRTAAGVAGWVLQLQEALQQRLAIGVVAAGTVRADGSVRCDVEDLLAAGAVIDQLAQLGIDASSPEAAAAEASYRMLSRAVGHLVSASVGGRAAATASADHAVDLSLGPDAVRVARDHPDRAAVSPPTG